MNEADKSAAHCDIDRYLMRIGCADCTRPTADNLFRLQSAHLHTVPYENLDILSGIPLLLEIPDLYSKIVLNRRGGYCFELNGLFGWLLRQLGYPVTDHFARFLRGETEIPKRRHRVLRVTADGRDYVCDVGVGSPCPEFPILLCEGAVGQQRGVSYRLVHDDFLGNVIEEYFDGNWGRYYAFTGERQLPVDFVTTDYFCQNAPESIFRKGRMLGIMTPYGKNTISGDRVRVIDENGKREFTPHSDAEWLDVYRTYFGITL